MLDIDHDIVEKAVAVAMGVLPRRLSVREMAAAAGVSLWLLHRAFDRACQTTPMSHLLGLRLDGARRDLERAGPGDTVFAVARRWGFSGPDGAFRKGYRKNHHELPSDTLKRARERQAQIRARGRAAGPRLVCLECGRPMRRLRRHLDTVHHLTPETYRSKWNLPADCRSVCGRPVRGGMQGRQPARRLETLRREKRIAEESVPSKILVAEAERHVLAALPSRLSEASIADFLGVSIRTLRHAFRDRRNALPYAAIHDLRLDEARRRLQANPEIAAAEVARQCGFGLYARFRKDFVVRFGYEPDETGCPPPPPAPIWEEATGCIAAVWTAKAFLG